MSYSMNAVQSSVCVPASRAPSFMSRLLAGFAISRQRACLRGLDDAALADIGVSRSQADQESNRPFWDVPSHWRG